MLLLTNIQAEQTGKYTVEVMNIHNCDVAAASVAVESTPDRPSGKPVNIKFQNFIFLLPLELMKIFQKMMNKKKMLFFQCISKGVDRISVAWCGPPYDGGCIITGFV